MIGLIETTIKFIETWQVLIGSFIGSSLTIIGSILFLRYEEKFREKKKQKEYYRLLEIFLTTILNDLFYVKRELKKFINILKEEREYIILLQKQKGGVYIIDIPFPTFSNVFNFNNSFIKEKSFDYYIHNKVLNIFGHLKRINSDFSSRKEDFIRILEEIKEKIPKKERDTKRRNSLYIQILDGYIKSMDEFVESIDEFIADIVSAKLYNEFFLRGLKEITDSNLFLKIENIRKKKNISLDDIDVIDSLLSEYVKKEIFEANQREEKITKI